MPEQFRHEALDISTSSVRLLDSLPTGLDKPPCFDLHTTVLDQQEVLALEYTAVSYEWGPDDDHGYIIEINGMLYPVRRNLYQFLVTLVELHPGGVRNLWIDAICIDQSSISEKNHQVQQMSKIYRHASKVIVWLGPATDSSNLIFDMFPRSPTHDTITKDGSELTAEQDVSDWQMNLIVECMTFGPAFVKLCQRSYWTRTWIVQELLLANDIELICGLKRTTWDLWVLLFSTLGTSIVLSSWAKAIDVHRKNHAVRLVRARNQYADKSNSMDLIDVVQQFEDFQCAIPQDKIYAMLGLCGKKIDLRIDYNLSAP